MGRGPLDWKKKGGEAHYIKNKTKKGRGLFHRKKKEEQRNKLQSHFVIA